MGGKAHGREVVRGGVGVGEWGGGSSHSERDKGKVRHCLVRIPNPLLSVAKEAFPWSILGNLTTDLLSTIL